MKWSFGTNCKDRNHKLISVSPEQIVEYIASGDKGLAEHTKILRRVKRMSTDRYKDMKTALPFFTCSTFDPPQRRREHFLKATGLIVDIDFKAGFDARVYERLKADLRVYLAYISPGGEGIKLVFVFDEPVSDARRYQAYYKDFVKRFATEYGIVDVVDTVNSDVSRISFLCHDENVFYNSDAVPLPVSDFEAPPPDESLDDKDIPPDVYRQILERLGTRPRPKTRQYPIDEAIKLVIPVIREALQQYGIGIKETVPIAYGLKIKTFLREDEGEVNLYHGKRGFTVVISPRRGTHPDLNETTRRIVEFATTRPPDPDSAGDNPEDLFMIE